MKLQSGTTLGDETHLGVKGKHQLLPLPSALPTGAPLVTELHARDGSSDVCWEAEFDTPTRSDATQFKAHTP